MGDQPLVWGVCQACIQFSQKAHTAASGLEAEPSRQTNGCAPNVIYAGLIASFGVLSLLMIRVLQMTLMLLLAVPTSMATTVGYDRDVPVAVGPLPDLPGPVPEVGGGRDVWEAELHVEITCILKLDDPEPVSCRACMGPGETETLPVEPQGSGVAVGVPGEPGKYAEQDALEGRASCG